MRALFLAVGAAMSLAGCGGDRAADDTTSLDQNLATEEILVNDTTAIDAATGADANIAADVELNVPVNIADGNEAQAEQPRERRREVQEDEEGPAPEANETAPENTL